MKVALAAAILVLLAGCATHPQAPPTPTGGGPGPTEGLTASYPQATCSNLLLFQLFDYHTADVYLPPGFHPRDPQDFLATAVAFGQAGAIFLELSCTSPEGGNLSAAALGIFVEPPAVPGLEAAKFDFYEVQRYGPPSVFDAVLRRGDWPMAAAALSLDVNGGLTKGQASSAGSANVTDAQGLVASLIGVMATPVPLGEGAVRFWHDGSNGLAYLDYNAVLSPLVGTGSCTARAGTPLQAIATAGSPAPPVPPVPMVGSPTCPPGEPILATFPGLTIEASARSLPGVHAG